MFCMYYFVSMTVVYIKENVQKSLPFELLFLMGGSSKSHVMLLWNLSHRCESCYHINNVDSKVLPLSLLENFQIIALLKIFFPLYKVPIMYFQIHYVLQV